MQPVVRPRAFCYSFEAHSIVYLPLEHQYLVGVVGAEHSVPNDIVFFLVVYFIVTRELFTFDARQVKAGSFRNPTANCV